MVIVCDAFDAERAVARTLISAEQKDEGNDEDEP